MWYVGCAPETLGVSAQVFDGARSKSWRGAISTPPQVLASKRRTAMRARSLGKDTCRNLEDAVMALHEMVMPGLGGGGGGSTRSTVSRFINVANQRHRPQRVRSSSPPIPALAINGVAIAKYDFEDAKCGELAFRCGDLLSVLNLPADFYPPAGWLRARSISGSCGLVPEAYLEPVASYLDRCACGDEDYSWSTCTCDEEETQEQDEHAHGCERHTASDGAEDKAVNQGSTAAGCGSPAGLVELDLEAAVKG
jgi:hypothetical protein